MTHRPTPPRRVPGTAARLAGLAVAAGDRVEVERGGEWIVFLVTGVERYPKDDFPTDRVYRPTPTPELRLITCGGSFDRARGVYRDNIVVYAVAA